MTAVNRFMILPTENHLLKTLNNGRKMKRKMAGNKKEATKINDSLLSTDYPAQDKCALNRRGTDTELKHMNSTPQLLFFYPNIKASV